MHIFTAVLVFPSMREDIFGSDGFRTVLRLGQVIVLLASARFLSVSCHATIAAKRFALFLICFTSPIGYTGYLILLQRFAAAELVLTILQSYPTESK